MPYLTIKNGENVITVEFFGTPILREILADNGYSVISPCGGKGVCGKCAVAVSGDISEPDGREVELGCRLSCRVRLIGNACVEIATEQYAFDKENDYCRKKKSDFAGLGAAIDIGTTTVVLRLFDSYGRLVGEKAALNPQRSVASDVLGRISASLDGKGALLSDMIIDCIKTLAKDICKDINRKSDEIERTVISGNTAMLYLLTNRNPESISRYPFEADELFGVWVDKTYLAACMNAYVGGDITCAVLSSGMCEGDKTVLLCDIGTNGEIALWKDGRLFVTSAAAGPAFEGSEISCGCQNIVGAVNRVGVEDRKIVATTVGNEKAIGINGTGLVDAVASFLKLDYIDKTGYAEKPLEIKANGGSIELTQDDIRALQLAKAAIRAGIETLLESTDTKTEDIDEFLIAGSFGSNLSIDSAVKIGLIPSALAGKARCIGNAALNGAADILFDDGKIVRAEEIANSAKHIQLGGSEQFYDRFISAIDFE